MLQMSVGINNEASKPSTAWLLGTDRKQRSPSSTTFGSAPDACCAKANPASAYRRVGKGNDCRHKQQDPVADKNAEWNQPLHGENPDPKWVQWGSKNGRWPMIPGVGSRLSGEKDGQVQRLQLSLGRPPTISVRGRKKKVHVQIINKNGFQTSAALSRREEQQFGQFRVN